MMQYAILAVKQYATHTTIIQGPFFLIEIR